MLRENLHEAFSIVVKTLDECEKSTHAHNFYELVYIVSGTGAQCINDQRFNYHAGHIFLLAPEDFHAFDIKTTTTLFFLRFNSNYVKDSGLPAKAQEQLKHVLLNASHTAGCVLKIKEDKRLVKPLIDAIISEYSNPEDMHYELVQQYVNTLILLVGRNILKFNEIERLKYADRKILQLISYIQTNIFFPDLLKVEVLSVRFNTAEKYLGRYFKKHTGQTLQGYIQDYKLKLIEQRLQFSDKRMVEIAEEFNFADESHLNKFFKSAKKVSPSIFRKQFAQQAS